MTVACSPFSFVPAHNKADVQRAALTIFGPNWRGQDPLCTGLFSVLDHGAPMHPAEALRILLDVAPAYPAAMQRAFMSALYMRWRHAPNTFYDASAADRTIRASGHPAAVIIGVGWRAAEIRQDIERLGSGVAVVEEMASELANARGGARSAVFERLCQQVAELVVMGFVSYGAALKTLKRAGRKCRLVDDMGVKVFDGRFWQTVWAANHPDNFWRNVFASVAA
jgi:hypothetical protein